ncbi:hypothetical protein BJ508DRAFT_335646 [Ascobolus immersus RN42]|uniref:Uncharacterized protein n=1 Tax=Ascobolus immersus RN42 TaxID=1160509 RepID=A0A3N4HBL4_ASCIM|nr:hypothetical protein BJ508DRAFT_335646 [Ascobolus immersus RN42]
MGSSPIPSLFTLPPELILLVFKHAPYLKTIEALAEAHPRFQAILDSNNSAIYTALTARLYGPKALRLLMLSTPGALLDKTRKFLAAHARPVSAESREEYWNLMEEVQPDIRENPQTPDFWISGAFFGDGGTMDKIGFLKARWTVTKNWWEPYEKIYTTWKTRSFNYPELEAASDDSDDSDDSVAPFQCLPCKEAADGHCYWHGRCYDAEWINKRRKDGVLSTTVQVAKDVTLFYPTGMFQCFLDYMFFYAIAATPHPNSEPPAFAAWSCPGLNQESCTHCKPWAKVREEGGLHFFDYSFTGELVKRGKEAHSLFLLERVMSGSAEPELSPFADPFLCHRSAPEHELGKFYYGVSDVDMCNLNAEGEFKFLQSSKIDFDSCTKIYFNDESWPMVDVFGRTHASRGFDLRRVTVELPNGNSETRTAVVRRSEWDDYICAFKLKLISAHSNDADMAG